MGRRLSWDQAKAMALALPQAQERDHFGSPSFRIEGKIFAQLSARDHADPRAILKLTCADQAALIVLDPQAFSPVPRWGKHGWTSVRLQSIDAALFRDALIKSWRAVAPKRLVAALDATRR